MPMSVSKYTCDGFYLNCLNVGDEDESIQFGMLHPYYRKFCQAEGLYDGKPCFHCYVDGKRMIKRKNGVGKGIKIKRVTKL